MNWLTIVHGIVTQGRHVNKDTGCCAEWTTSYIVRYSLDGQAWETVKEKNGNNRVRMSQCIYVDMGAAKETLQLFCKN